MNFLLIGRPNAGNSSLYNILTSGKNNIIHKEGGTTRDWHKSSVKDLDNIFIYDTPGVIIQNDKIDKVLNAVFSESEILKALQKLKCSKSPGFDGILNEMLKFGSHVLLKPLCILFNAILSSGTFPGQWKNAILVPIFKSVKC